ncbi:MAG TPA: hypothetical protein DCW52_03775 [Gammaproteobacteria bacterium]|nr:hypothetical protein [Gammaproteobacteria bacterium]
MFTLLTKNAIAHSRKAITPLFSNHSVLRVLVAFPFLFTGLNSHASNELTVPVADYEIDCGETFECPQSLMPRVHFWVEVFSRWDTETAVFHDKENPHRVYSTVSRRDGCRRSKAGDSLDRERTNLGKSIKGLASALSAGRSLTDKQKRLHAKFKGESSSQIRAAADRLRCQSGNSNRMLGALEQFKLYRPTILDALESQNLTPELQYLPFVESAFNPKALSHVGAAGLWQIMPSTGRTLGLTVNETVDDRYDPTRATYGAARYFRNSVDRLSTTAFENGHTVVAKELNPFVVTSYNYGVRGMQRAIQQVGLDYERLLKEYKSPSFQTAVRNFYASFLAARHVAQNSEYFFGEITPDFSDRIYAFNTVKLDRKTSARRLVDELNLDSDEFKKLNPSFKSVIWKHKALIPANYEIRLPFKESGWSQQLASVNSLPVEIERPGFVLHRVRSGESACVIAQKYKASCSQLIKLNGLDRRATVYVGKQIKVPTLTGGISVAAVNKPLESSDTYAVYSVRSGDTACKIAARHSMKCQELLAINGLSRSSVIKIGQVLNVSGSDDWHVVTAGQTACGIAERYGVGCSSLLRANRLALRSTIRVGQRLRIPRGAGS